MSTEDVPVQPLVVNTAEAQTTPQPPVEHVPTIQTPTPTADTGGTSDQSNVPNSAKRTNKPRKRPSKRTKIQTEANKAKEAKPGTEEPPPPLKKPKFQKQARTKVTINDLPNELIHEIIEYCPGLDYTKYKILRDSPAFKFLDKYYLPITNIRNPGNLKCFRSLTPKSIKAFTDNQYFNSVRQLRMVLKNHLDKYKVEASQVTVFFEYEELFQRRNLLEEMYKQGKYERLYESSRYDNSNYETREYLQTITSDFKKTWVYFTRNYTSGGFSTSLNGATVVVLNHSALRSKTFDFLRFSPSLRDGQRKTLDVMLLEPPKELLTKGFDESPVAGLELFHTTYLQKHKFYELEKLEAGFGLKTKDTIKLDMIPNVKDIRLTHSPVFLNHILNFQGHHLEKLECLKIENTFMNDFAKCSFPSLKTLKIVDKGYRRDSGRKTRGFNFIDNQLPSLETFELDLKEIKCFYGNQINLENLKDVYFSFDTDTLTGRTTIPDILNDAKNVKINSLAESDSSFYEKIFKLFKPNTNKIESLILIGFDLNCVSKCLSFNNIPNLQSLKLMKCTSTMEPLSIPPYFRNLETLHIIHHSIPKVLRTPSSLRHVAFTLPESSKISDRQHFNYEDYRFENTNWVFDYAKHEDVYTKPYELRRSHIGLSSPQIYFIDHKYLRDNPGKGIELMYQSRLNYEKDIYEKNLIESLNGAKAKDGRFRGQTTLVDLLKKVSGNTPKGTQESSRNVLRRIKRFTSTSSNEEDDEDGGSSSSVSNYQRALREAETERTLEQRIQRHRESVNLDAFGESEQDQA